MMQRQSFAKKSATLQWNKNKQENLTILDNVTEHPIIMTILFKQLTILFLRHFVKIL